MVLQAVVVYELALHQLLLVVILKERSPPTVLVGDRESPLSKCGVQLRYPTGRVEHVIGLLRLVLLVLVSLLQLLQLSAGHLELLAVRPLVQIACLLLSGRLRVLALQQQLLAVCSVVMTRYLLLLLDELLL